MKKLLTSTFALIITVSLSAQVQSGKVRTAGSPDKHGEPLSGVIVTMRGGTNSALTDGNGRFEVPMRGVAEGDAISLERVSKNNYVLLDEDILYTEYPFSQSVPLEIVMKSVEEIRKEREEIIQRSQATLRVQYDARIADLESRLKSESITSEYYISQYNILVDQKQKYEKMIGSIADHYSKIDYDRLDSLDREITRNISAGDFERADSLLNSKGDLNARLASHKEEQAIIASREQQLLADKSANEDNGRRLAADFFNKHTVALGRFNVDSAAYFIEKRAEVDTTNWEYQYDAAAFLFRNKAEYEKSVCYLSKALNHCDTPESQVLCYLRLGEINTDLAEYDKASECYRNALTVCEADGSDDRYRLDSYYNIASLEFKRANYATALEYYNKIQNILANSDNSDYSELVRDLYLALSVIHNQMGNYDMSDEYITKALAESEKLDEYYSHQRANVFSQLAHNYVVRRDFVKAEDLFSKALDISLKINSRIHPDVASLYNSLGLVYDEQKKPDEALECHNEALNIRLKLFGENHPDVAHSYNSMASIYKTYKMYDEARSLYEKALKIRRTVYGDAHDDVATIYNNIATIDANEGRLEDAKDYFSRAKDIYVKQFGPKHPKVGQMLLNIGTIDMDVDKDLATEELEQYLDIVSDAFGPESDNMASAYYDVALAYNGVDTGVALSYMIRAKEIYQKDGFDQVEEALLLRRMANVYSTKSEFEKSIEYQTMAVKVIDDFHNNFSDSAIQLRWELYDYYFKLKNFIGEGDLDAWETSFDEFMSSYSVSINAVDPESAAVRSGISGRYEILRYNDWTVDCTLSFFNEVSKGANASKHLVLYKDGEIITRTFDGTIGVRFDLVKLDPSEKDRMIDMYYDTLNNK